jgi:hypothetical protein
MIMRSHLTAFGVGAALSLVAAGALALIAPHFVDSDAEDSEHHVVNISDEGGGSFHFRDDAGKLTAEWRGDFSFAADGRSLTALEDRLEVSAKVDGAEQKAVFKKAGGRIEISAHEDDRALSGVDAQEKAADLLQIFARTSGVNADGRVKAMMAAGGKAAVLAEIGALIGGHAVGAYVGALAEEAKLTDEEIKRLTERVQTLDSDYAKRSALSALLTTQTLSDAAVAAVLAAAKTIDGDHEIRLIVADLAETEMSERNFAAAVALLDEIEGDHEIRLAASALLESDGLADAAAARALDAAAARIEGDHEMRLVIDAASGRIDAEDVAAAAIRAVGQIEGAHERRLAIDLVAGELGPQSAHWAALIDAAGAIDSDHEKRLAIEALRAQAPEDDALRGRLREAASAIASDHERRLALEALE